VQARDQIDNLVDYTANGTIAWEVQTQHGDRQSPYGFDVTMPSSSQQFVNGTLNAQNLSGSIRLVSAVPQRFRVTIIYGSGADDTVRSAWSSWIMVFPGSRYKTEIRLDQVDKYSWADTLNLTADDSLVLYAGLYDTLGNYVQAAAPVWSSNNLTPAISVTDSVVRHVLTGAGTGTVTATFGMYQPDVVMVTVADKVAVRFDQQVVPFDISVISSRPNPAFGTTTIYYHVFTPSSVKLQVLNIRGEMVASFIDQHTAAGTYTFNWDSRNCPAGVYVIKLLADRAMYHRNIFLMK
jgi:hypothetical protein